MMEMYTHHLEHICVTDCIIMLIVLQRLHSAYLNYADGFPRK